MTEKYPTGAAVQAGLTRLARISFNENHQPHTDAEEATDDTVIAVGDDGRDAKDLEDPHAPLQRKAGGAALEGAKAPDIQ